MDTQLLPFEFIDNVRCKGAIRFDEGFVPHDGDICYLTDRHRPSVKLVRLHDTGTSYDAGKRGVRWIEIEDLGTPSFFEGQLCIPESNPGKNSLPSTIFGRVNPRNEGTDELVLVAVCFRERLIKANDNRDAVAAFVKAALGRDKI